MTYSEDLSQLSTGILVVTAELLAHCSDESLCTASVASTHIVLVPSHLFLGFHRSFSHHHHAGVIDVKDVVLVDDPPAEDPQSGCHQGKTWARTLQSMLSKSRQRLHQW